MLSDLLVTQMNLIFVVMLLCFGTPTVQRAAAVDGAGGSSYTFASSDSRDGRDGRDRFTFALVDVNNNVNITGFWDSESNELDAAKAAAKHDGHPVLWVRDSGKRYLLRDAALVRRAREIMAPMIELGHRQGELGRQQGELGASQGRLGAEQGRLGARQGVLAGKLAALEARYASSRSSDDRDLGQEIAQLRAEIDEMQRDLARRQAELSVRQQPLAREQAELGQRQAELGRLQEKASREASLGIQRLVEEAIHDGKVEELE